MQIPVENVLAAYPPSRRAGAVTLMPLTLGGALALAAMGVREVTDDFNCSAGLCW